MNTTTTKPVRPPVARCNQAITARPKFDLLSAIDKTDPRQVAIGLYLLRQRQKRKQLEAQKRGAK